MNTKDSLVPPSLDEDLEKYLEYLQKLTKGYHEPKMSFKERIADRIWEFRYWLANRIRPGSE